jgi:glycosyltransferase involved in cell wall biosynthesis
MNATVDICLAAYNGERYLANFYASIAAQSHSNWRLLVRDDGSTDSTPQIIERLACDDSRVVPLTDALGNLGVVKNFAEILGRCAAPYLMLADQDDVWYPQKIRDSLNVLCALQAHNPQQDRPLVVFTDVHVVDEALNVINESFIRMQRLDSLRYPSFGQLLTQNVAPGCTMIMNRALLKAALPIPAQAAMHDWWLMLVAAAIGEIGFVAKPTVAYRQHGSNVIGAKRFRILDAPSRLASYRSRLRQAQLQAGEIARRYSDQMRAGDVAAASALETLSRVPVGLRQVRAYRRGLRKAGLIRNVAFLLFM